MGQNQAFFKLFNSFKSNKRSHSGDDGVGTLFPYRASKALPCRGSRRETAEEDSGYPLSVPSEMNKRKKKSVCGARVDMNSMMSTRKQIARFQLKNARFQSKTGVFLIFLRFFILPILCCTAWFLLSF